MNEITVHKAEPVLDEDVPDAAIHIDKPIPADATAQETREMSSDDARAMAEVLWVHLPGATLDALIAELLRRRASQFTVPLPAKGVG
jgi:hypothetical protein